MGKRELVALLNLSSWCLVMVERLFLAMPWGCLRFVIVGFPDHTDLLFLSALSLSEFTGESVIPIDSSLQKSSRLGFFFLEMTCLASVDLFLSQYL